jgi:hypothetical protein
LNCRTAARVKPGINDKFLDLRAAGLHRPVQAQVDRFSKRMPEMTGERGCFSGKERARRPLEQ